MWSSEDDAVLVNNGWAYPCHMQMMSSMVLGGRHSAQACLRRYQELMGIVPPPMPPELRAKKSSNHPKKQPLHLTEKILDALKWDEVSNRSFKDATSGFLKGDLTGDDFLEKIEAFGLVHLLSDIANSLMEKFPRRKSELLHSIKRKRALVHKQKLESEKTRSGKLFEANDPPCQTPLTSRSKGIEAKNQTLTTCSKGIEAKNQTLTSCSKGIEAKSQTLTSCSKGIETKNQTLTSCSKGIEARIERVIRQIRGTKDNVRTKSNEIVEILKDTACPVSIGFGSFAKKMISASQKDPFARSYVIVCVTSQFPEAMDILLAEFHKCCIYTVPKHSELKWDSEAYQRLESIMRLYGALIQTDDIRSANATNYHGIEHGWKWCDWFLNHIPANNRAAAIALNAFLQTAGFGLHQRSKSQFLRVVNLVREHFLAKKDFPEDLRVIIAAYIEKKMYLNEPCGRTMARSVVSAEW